MGKSVIEKVRDTVYFMVAAPALENDLSYAT
jgi:hypothetical protein